MGKSEEGTAGLCFRIHGLEEGFTKNERGTGGLCLKIPGVEEGLPKKEERMMKKEERMAKKEEGMPGLSLKEHKRGLTPKSKTS